MTRLGLDLANIARQWFTNGSRDARSSEAGTSDLRIRHADDEIGGAVKGQMRLEHL